MSKVGKKKAVHRAAKGGAVNVLVQVVSEKLHVINLNVGQGAGILFLITKKVGSNAPTIEYSFLVDGGYASYKDYIWDVAGKRKIDAACITHADADHANCPIEMKASIAKFYLPYPSFPGALPGAEVPTLGSENELWASAVCGTKLKIKWMHVYNPSGRLLDGENSKSLGALLTFGNFSFYFDGDLDPIRQKDIKGLGAVNGLYVTHHGSEKTSDSDFLSAVQPQVAVISTGQNSHGHPDHGLMTRLVKTVPHTDVLLTGCHYNRLHVNRKYWDTEYANLARWLKDIRQGNKPLDFCKIVDEYYDSLCTSLEEACTFAEVTLTTTVTTTQASFRATFADLHAGDKAASNALTLFDIGVLHDLKTVFDAAQRKQDAETDDGKITLSGGGDVMGAVIITVDADSPREYDVLWHDASQAIKSKRYPLSAGAKPAPLLGQDYNFIYTKTCRTGNLTPHFASSNRYKRDGTSPYRYKCSKCGNNIQVPLTEVLVSCSQPSCAEHGPFAYHPQCFIDAWAAPGRMPDELRSDGSKPSADLMAQIAAYKIEVDNYTGVDTSDLNGTVAQAPFRVAEDQLACLRYHKTRPPSRNKRSNSTANPNVQAATSNKKSRK